MGGHSSKGMKRSSTMGCFPQFDAIDGDAYGMKRSTSFRDSKRGKPGPPECTPKISEISPNSLTLSWKCPSDRGLGLIFAYTIESITNKSRNWAIVTSSCQGTMYTVKKLNPRLTYSFRVRAENIHGVGKPGLPSHPVCTEHAMKHHDRHPDLRNSIPSNLIRSESLDATARYSVRTMCAKSELPNDFEREWKTMSMRNGGFKRTSGNDIGIRATVLPRQRPKLRGSVYECPSDRSSISSDVTYRPDKRQTRLSSQSPEPEIISKVRTDYKENITSKSADDILSNGIVESVQNRLNDNVVDDRDFIRRHPIKSYNSSLRESHGEIDMGFLNEINNLDLALRRSYNTQTPIMKNSHTSPDIFSAPDFYQPGVVNANSTQYDASRENTPPTLPPYPVTNNHYASANSCETIKFDDYNDNPDYSQQNNYKYNSDNNFSHPHTNNVHHFHDNTPTNNHIDYNQHFLIDDPNVIHNTPNNLNTTTQNAHDWLESIWNEVEKSPVETSQTIRKNGGESTPRIISNTLTCDWESLSDTSIERTLDWRNASEESLTKHLEEDSEIDCNYDFD